MFHSTKTFVCCLTAIMLMCACGKQHKAEETVKDFLDNNLRIKEYSVNFTKIDSTKLVSDSLIYVMRTNASKNASFKSGITYNANPPQRIYIFTKAKIYIGKDTLQHTFYLNPELTHVVSFKDS